MHASRVPLEETSCASPEEIRLDRERLDLALDAANTCTWDNDMVENVLRFDARWSVMLGGRPIPVSMPAHMILRYVHPEDRARSMRHVKACYRGEDDLYRHEQRVRTLQGAWIWVLSSGRVVRRDAAGRATRMIGTNTDITARKAAEAALRQQKEFLAALQRTTLDLLARRDLSDVFQTLVERASAIMNAPFGELMLKDGDALVVCAFTRSQPYLTGPRIARGEAPLSWQAHDTGQPALTADYSGLGDRQPRYASAAVGSVAEFPVMLDGACVGVLAVGRARHARVFDSGDIEKGQHLAQMAALVLHNAGIRAVALREAAARTDALRESEERFRLLAEVSPRRYLQFRSRWRLHIRQPPLV